MILTHTNTEDKNEYCREAALKQEPRFVRFINALQYCHLKAEINPEKETDIYTCDLLVNGLKSDLKTQDTPFFKAQTLYGIDPQWAITYNRKDYLRYKDIYTSKGVELFIFFDVTRKDEEMFGIKTWPMRAIFVARASEIEKLVEVDNAPLHEYINRKNDTSGNAKSSYVFDVRAFRLIYYEGKSLKLN